MFCQEVFSKDVLPSLKMFSERPLPMETSPLAFPKRGRLSLAELERRCQKPDYQRVGTWMARRIARPAALRITWCLAPWGVSANMMTWFAWAVSMASAWAFAAGNVWGWTWGALLLQLWYLLDHVDGQLARLRGTASLDGVQLDYLMHHSVSLAIPLGVGFGMFQQNGQTLWLLAGAMWGWGGLLVGLQNDAQYKAFFHRLWTLREQGQPPRGRPVSDAPSALPVRPTVCPEIGNRSKDLYAGALASNQGKGVVGGAIGAAGRWIGRKTCEIHVVMNLLTVLAAVAWLAQVWPPMGWVSKGYVVGMSVLAPVVALGSLWRSQRQQRCEKEFAQWFFLPGEVSEIGYSEEKNAQNTQDASSTQHKQT